MNLRKRFLAVMMAACMLLTCLPMGAIAEETTEQTVTLTDIDADTTVGKAVTELVKLGIINGYEDNTFRQDNTITRGEVSKIIIAFLGQESIAFDTIPSGFPDVDDANHWAKKYVKLAADQKIVNGYTDGTFQPDAPVKYTEIVKMLVCALGYGQMAEDRTTDGSPWYSGYMAIAAEKGILKNASVNHVEDNASRGIVAILTNNCLGVTILEVDASGNILTDSGVTALDKFQGKEKVVGVVTGVQQTGIYSGATGLSANQITVEVKGKSTVYNVPESYDTMSILGKKISAYVEKGMDDALLMSQITVTKTEVFSVNAEMVESTAGDVLTIYPQNNDGRAQKIGFAGVRVIYNGKYDSTYDTAAFRDLGAATLSLICNDGDGDAEVAFVTEYENFVVNSAEKNLEHPAVYGKYGAGTLNIPYKNSSVYFSLTKEGTNDAPEAIISALTEWNVVSVMRSKPTAEGKGVWKAIVNTQKVSGKITESMGATRKKIGGKFYDYAENYEKYTGAKPEMKVGDSVTIYLDSNGKIAAASVSAAQSTLYLAYLINAAYEEDIEGRAYVSFYGITGETKKKTMELHLPIRIDGKNYKDGKAALDALCAAATVFNEGKTEAGMTVTPYSQLIQYTKNGAGKVDMIDTVLDPQSTADLSLHVSFPKDNTVLQGTEKTLRHTTSGRFEKEDGTVAFIANTGTKVLEVPRDVTDTSKYLIRNSFVNYTRYQVEAFNVGSTKIAKFAISYTGGVFSGNAAINSKSPIMIATELSSIQAEDKAGIVDKASGYAFPSGSAVNIKSEAENVLIGKYGLGDIFRYAEADGEVVETERVLTFGTTRPSIFNRDGVEISAPLTGDAETVAASAKTGRKFKVDTLSDTSTAGGFVFGTVIGFEKADNGQMSLSLVPTIKEDEGGVQLVDEFLFDNIVNAKVFLYDYTASKDANKVLPGVNLEGNLNPYAVTGNFETASQILVYYTGAYSVKAIIIFRY